MRRSLAERHEQSRLSRVQVRRFCKEVQIVLDQPGQLGEHLQPQSPGPGDASVVVGIFDKINVACLAANLVFAMCA